MSPSNEQEGSLIKCLREIIGLFDLIAVGNILLLETKIKIYFDLFSHLHIACFSSEDFPGHEGQGSAAGADAWWERHDLPVLQSRGSQCAAAGPRRCQGTPAATTA